MAPTPAREQQGIRAVLRQPSRHMATQRPGAARDQNRSTGLEPTSRDSSAPGRADQPSYKQPRGAQRELVLPVAIPKPSQKALKGLGIEDAAHVDEPSPAL